MTDYVDRSKLREEIHNWVATLDNCGNFRNRLEAYIKNRDIPYQSYDELINGLTEYLTDNFNIKHKG